MRPDEHKSRDSKRYQARKLKQGDSSASEVAEARKLAAIRARDKGTGIAAIRRRNGEAPPQTAEREPSTSFARRKLGTNADRYKEVSAEDELAQDAELGIDRETTELAEMLDETDDSTGGSYFKFKEEQVWAQTTDQEEQLYRTMMQVDFDSYEGVLQQINTRKLLGLSEKDIELVDCAFEQEPITVTKPIVPAVTRNAKGLVLFKSLMITEPKKIDGIYLRNDGSNHRVATNNPKVAVVDDTEQEDLDELLALDTPKVTENPVRPSARPTTKEPQAIRPSVPKPLSKKGLVLPKPGATRISKPSQAIATEDEAWLDDILG
ncbi:hypothetical protein CLU79DRAFT_830817 [Phycomyces nitens]|nr:hypothetical protein CLU79DRAFT_830817 [Phycomyces nitens]